MSIEREKLLSLIHEVRPGGITTEKLAELTGHSVDDLTAALTAMSEAGVIRYYVRGGMRFWRNLP